VPIILYLMLTINKVSGNIAKVLLFTTYFGGWIICPMKKY
jgi:hypothetical protein